MGQSGPYVVQHVDPASLCWLGCRPVCVSVSLSVCMSASLCDSSYIPLPLGFSSLKQFHRSQISLFVCMRYSRFSCLRVCVPSFLSMSVSLPLYLCMFLIILSCICANMLSPLRYLCFILSSLI